MQLGLVTYLWGAEWDLPTLIKNCETAGFEGVELRTTHKHGVEPTLDESQRAAVAKRFGDSRVQLVGLGSTCEFQSPDPAIVKKNIEECKSFIRLCHDVGGGGVKVRPNGLPKEVPVEKTVEQIGKALNEVGEYAEGYGVEIRVEVHGRGTAEIPVFKRIMDVARHENVKVCWNCNPDDTLPPGLAANFKSLADRLGTVHIHDLISDYPWRELFGLLKAAGYEGWTLLEGDRPSTDALRVMQYYKLVWEGMAK